MRGFGPRMSRILDVFVRKLYWMLFIVRAIVVRDLVIQVHVNS